MLYAIVSVQVLCQYNAVTFVSWADQIRPLFISRVVGRSTISQYRRLEDASPAGICPMGRFMVRWEFIFLAFSREWT